MKKPISLLILFLLAGVAAYVSIDRGALRIRSDAYAKGRQDGIEIGKFEAQCATKGGQIGGWRGALIGCITPSPDAGKACEGNEQCHSQRCIPEQKKCAEALYEGMPGQGGGCHNGTCID